MLSTPNFRMSGDLRIINISPGYTFTVWHPSAKEVVKAEQPEPSCITPHPCPKEVEEKVQEDCLKGLAKNKNNQVQNNKQND